MKPDSEKPTQKKLKMVKILKIGGNGLFLQFVFAQMMYAASVSVCKIANSKNRKHPAHFLQ